MKAAVSLFITIVIALAVWTAYANVYSDDTAVRAQGEKIARTKAGCGTKCNLTRMDGKRGVLETTLSYTFDSGLIVVTCKRPYLAFGEFVCK